MASQAHLSRPAEMYGANKLIIIMLFKLYGKHTEFLNPGHGRQGTYYVSNILEQVIRLRTTIVQV